MHKRMEQQTDVSLSVSLPLSLKINKLKKIKNQQYENKMTITPYMSTITLNESGLNTSIKRHNVGKENKTLTCAAYTRLTSD